MNGEIAQVQIGDTSMLVSATWCGPAGGRLYFWDLPRRRVYCASEIKADCDSCPPTQTTAELVAFDMDDLKVVARRRMEEGRTACTSRKASISSRSSTADRPSTCKLWAM